MLFNAWLNFCAFALLLSISSLHLAVLVSYNMVHVSVRTLGWWRWWWRRWWWRWWWWWWCAIYVFIAPPFLLAFCHIIFMSMEYLYESFGFVKCKTFSFIPRYFLSDDAGAVAAALPPAAMRQHSFSIEWWGCCAFAYTPFLAFSMLLPTLYDSFHKHK